MPKCDRSDGCEFFNNRMQRMPGTATIFKQNFCETDSSNCARYLVVDAIMDCPAELSDEAIMEVHKKMELLFPNNADIAREIISNYLT